MFACADMHWHAHDEIVILLSKAEPRLVYCPVSMNHIQKSEIRFSNSFEKFICPNFPKLILKVKFKCKLKKIKYCQLGLIGTNGVSWDMGLEPGKKQT